MSNRETFMEGFNRARYADDHSRDAWIVCQQCNWHGYVQTKSIKVKKGLSGGKATGALLTGGVSLLATGLSRKERVTEAHCSNCNSTWQF